MSMLKLKLIGAASLLLGAVACDPVPAYPQTNGPLPPYPPRVPDGRDQGVPYYDDQVNNRQGYDPRYDPDIPPVPPAPPVPSRDQYPTAERTANPNRVISPHPPYNVIDVSGFRSGQLAKDPTDPQNPKIFRVP